MVARTLLVLDFDHTVVDDNTDVVVQDLAGPLPERIKQLYNSRSWTDYMQRIFEHLHAHGVSRADYDQRLHAMPFVHGMCALLRHAHSRHIDCVIISDSNSFFIDTILQHSDLTQYVTRVFTNPANFDPDGCLRIQYYHTQDWCERSTVNLCKGSILTDYLAEEARKDAGRYSRVVYVGDGKNDLCPGLKLTQHDILFVRKGYTLETVLKTEQSLDMKADVRYFISGDEIAAVLI